MNETAKRFLEGKTALVTGAGRGLGRAFAERLAALGCSVGVHGMREHGPAEYGEGTTLTDTAQEIADLIRAERKDASRFRTAVGE